MKIRKVLLFPAFALIGSGLSGCSLLPTVTFYDEDGKTILEKDENVRLGSEISYDGKTPEKPADKQYVYTFDHWVNKANKKELKEGDKAWGFNFEYKAVYTEKDRYYDITWLNGDGEELAKTKEKWGATPKSPEIIYDEEGEKIGDDPDKIPTKDQDDQYVYSFYRWNPEPYAVEGDQTYTPEFTPNTRSYKVIFNDASGKEMPKYSQWVLYGDTPEAPSTDPTKDSTDEFDFEFERWEPAIHAVHSSADTVYNPIFKEIRRSYTVKFVNYDGENVQPDQVVEYGEMPVEPTNKPTKPEDDDAVYTFDGWDSPVSKVTGDIVYTAQYTATNKYTVQFVDWNGEELKSEVVLHGKTATAPSATPLRDHDNEYAYTFAGWDKDITKPITSDTVFTAEYDKTRIYNIKFMDGDTLLQDDWYLEGVVPVPPSDPSKEPDNEKVYKFKEWATEGGAKVGPATESTTYYAKYDERARLKFEISYFIDGSYASSELVFEHSDLSLPSIMDGYDVYWYSTPESTYPNTGKPVTTDVVDVFDNMTFYAVKYQKHEFSVEFVAGQGVFEHSGEYPAHAVYTDSFNLDEIDIANKPTLDGHHFIGWFDEEGNQVHTLSNVLEDVVLTARYDVNSYQISFVCDWGALSPIQATFNDDGYEANLPTPEKVGYTFDYWAYNDVKLEGPYTYTSDIEVTAVTHIDTYSLSYNLNGGIAGDNQPTSYTIENFDDVIPAASKVGYDFKYWTIEIGGQLYYLNEGDSLKDCFGNQFFLLGHASDLVLTANYSVPHTHTVTYNYNDGSHVYTVTYMDGTDEVATRPVAKGIYKAGFITLPNKANKQFAGWSTTPNGNILVNDINIDSDIKLYAKWNDIGMHPVYNPNDLWEVTYEFDKTIAIGSDETVQLYNFNGKYLQFTSYVEQDLVIKSTPNQPNIGNFEVLNSTTGDVLIHSEFSNACYQINLHVLAGQSYTIHVFGIQNETGSAIVSLTAADPTKSIYPEFAVSALEEDSTSVECRYGEALPKAVEVERLGYVFVGWFDANNKQYHDGDLLDVDADLELFAHWALA